MGTREIAQVLKPLADAAGPVLSVFAGYRQAFDAHVHQFVPFLPNASTVIVSVLVLRFLAKQLIGTACATLQARKVHSGHIWRNVHAFAELWTTPAPGCKTLSALFAKSASEHPDSNCLGSRETLAIEEEVQVSSRERV